MKLSQFIKNLKNIKSKYGDSIQVLMADGVSAVAPVYLKDFFGEKAVIITDQKKFEI